MKVERKTGHNVITKYYAQHVLELLNPGNTLLGELREAAPMESDQNLRNTLGGFLFSGDDVEKRISVLSGGEKARVALAKLLLQPSNLLLMDEPTNHLDIASREILADALGDYRGTICFITHDRTLIHQVANKVVEIEGGHPTIYPGDYEGYLYRKQKQEENRAAKTTSGNGAPRIADRPRSNGRGRRRIDVPEMRRRSLTKESQRLAERIQVVTTSLSEREARVAELEAMFGSPDLYEKPDQVAGLSMEYQELKAEVGRLWEEWERLSAEAESVDGELARL